MKPLVHLSSPLSWGSMFLRSEDSGNDSASASSLWAAPAFKGFEISRVQVLMVSFWSLTQIWATLRNKSTRGNPGLQAALCSPFFSPPRMLHERSRGTTSVNQQVTRSCSVLCDQKLCYSQFEKWNSWESAHPPYWFCISV